MARMPDQAVPAAGAGLALQGGNEAGHPDLAAKGIVERPRVLYNAASRRFVMWLHIDDEKVPRDALNPGCLPLALTTARTIPRGWDWMLVQLAFKHICS